MKLRGPILRMIFGGIIMFSEETAYLLNENVRDTEDRRHIFHCYRHNFYLTWNYCKINEVQNWGNYYVGSKPMRGFVVKTKMEQTMVKHTATVTNLEQKKSNSNPLLN